MKLILVTVGILATFIHKASGESISKDIRKMLIEVENLLGQIEATEVAVENIGIEKMVENPDVHKVELALESENTTEECAASIAENFRVLAEKINNKLIPAAFKNVTGDANFLENAKKELYEMDDGLEKLQQDKENKNKTLISTYHDKIEKLFRFVDTQRDAVVHSISSSPYLDSEELRKQIYDDLVTPANKCIKVE